MTTWGSPRSSRLFCKDLSILNLNLSIVKEGLWEGSGPSMRPVTLSRETRTLGNLQLRVLPVANTHKPDAQHDAQYDAQYARRGRGASRKASRVAELRRSSGGAPILFPRGSAALRAHKSSESCSLEAILDAGIRRHSL